MFVPIFELSVETKMLFLLVPIDDVVSPAELTEDWGFMYKVLPLIVAFVALEIIISVASLNEILAVQFWTVTLEFPRFQT